MERNAHRVLDVAYEKGIRYFDAARSYGLAEAFLSTWLARRAVRPGDVVVASKWGYTYTADWRVDAPTHEVKDHSLGVFTRQLAESRELLGEHLAVYQIHSATIESGVLDDVRVIDALAAARETGLRIGLSVSGTRQADAIWRALEVTRDGERVFATVQATWNLLERSAEPALIAASGEGVGVIVKEALANGLLARAGRDGDDGRFAPLAQLAEELGVSEDRIALSCALAQPWVSVVLSGATTVTQLESNVRSQQLALSHDLMTRLDGLRSDPVVYWRERSALPWN